MVRFNTSFYVPNQTLFCRCYRKKLTLSLDEENNLFRVFVFLLLSFILLNAASRITEQTKLSVWSKCCEKSSSQFAKVMTSYFYCLSNQKSKTQRLVITCQTRQRKEADRHTEKRLRQFIKSQSFLSVKKMD